jgi:hypothetical protein
MSLNWGNLFGNHRNKPQSKPASTNASAIPSLPPLPKASDALVVTRQGGAEGAGGQGRGASIVELRSVSQSGKQSKGNEKVQVTVNSSSKSPEREKELNTGGRFLKSINKDVAEAGGTIVGCLTNGTDSDTTATKTAAANAINKKALAKKENGIVSSVITKSKPTEILVAEAVNSEALADSNYNNETKQSTPSEAELGTDIVSKTTTRTDPVGIKSTTATISEPPASTLDSTNPSLDQKPESTATTDSTNPNATNEIYVRYISLSALKTYLQSLSSSLNLDSPPSTSPPPAMQPELLPHSQTKYLAISYKWQPPTAHLKIPVIQEKEKRSWLSESVTRDILEVSISLAEKLGLNWIWMDSFCIDQSRTPEGKKDKETFIPLMSKIFAGAEVVAGYAFGGKPGQVSDAGGGGEDGGVGESIANTEWYDRVWILQEMVLARRLFIYRGGKWNDLDSERLFWCKEVARGCTELAATGEITESAKKAIRVLGELSAAQRGNIREQKESDVEGGAKKNKKGLSLAQIARLLSNRQCLVPQDRVYGVFGILPFQSKIVANYEEPLVDVWQKLCMEAVFEHRDLSLSITRRNFYVEPASYEQEQIQQTNAERDDDSFPTLPHAKILGPLEAPEISYGLNIEWASNPSPLTYNPETKQWMYTQPIKSEVTSMERVPLKSNAATLPQYPKALKYLAESFEDLEKMDEKSAERKNKLEWICDAFFETQVMVESANGWKVVLEFDKNRNQAKSSDSHNDENTLVVHFPTSKNVLKAGQEIYLVYMGLEPPSTKRWMLLDKRMTLLQTFASLETDEKKSDEFAEKMNAWLTSERLTKKYEADVSQVYHKFLNVEELMLHI